MTSKSENVSVENETLRLLTRSKQPPPDAVPIGQPANIPSLIVPSLPSESEERKERRRQEAEIVRDMERRRVDASRAYAFATSGVPERHREASPIACAPEHAWTQTRGSLRDRLGSGMMVALLGSRGGGKTQLASDLIRIACLRDSSAHYVRVVDFFLAIKAAFAKNAMHSELDVVTDFYNYELLAVDEVGLRGETPFEDLQLGLMLDHRYGGHGCGQVRDTILISNQSPATFKAAVGESVADRLRETGGIIECTWPSFRGES